MNMGQCYSIILKVKVNDEAGLVKALQNKISRAETERVQYNLDHFAELGIGTGTLEDLFRIFFAGWEGKFTSTPDGKLLSDFDCSYGWENVMITAFDEIAPYLKDNSYIKIYSDSGCDYAKIKNGEAVWKS